MAFNPFKPFEKAVKWVRKGPVGKFVDKNLGNIGTVAGFALGGPAGAAIGRAAGSAVGPNREKTLGGFIKQGAAGYGLGQLGSMIPGAQKLASTGAEKAGLGQFISQGVRDKIAPAAASAMSAPAPQLAGSSIQPAGGAAGSAMRLGAPAPGGMTVPPMTASAPAASAGGELAAGGAALANADPGVGSYIKSAVQSLRDPANLSLALTGAGTALQGYGAYQQGKLEEEREEEDRRRRESQSAIATPLLMERLRAAGMAA